MKIDFRKIAQVFFDRPIGDTDPDKLIWCPCGCGMQIPAKLLDKRGRKKGKLPDTAHLLEYRPEEK